MKYFTPERYLHLGDLKSEQAFLAAQQDWEEALAAYRADLERIRDDLPTSLRRLVESVYLHDARVLNIHEGPRGRFTITLHPESTPEQLAILSYTLTEPPSVTRDVLPADRRRDPTAWLYDELSFEGGLFRHDILLSNGWVVSLRFRAASVTRPRALLPAARSA